jgi:hypothetical protein
MLIRSALRPEGGELKGYEAWRSEYRGARCENGMGRFRRNICEFDAHGMRTCPTFGRPWNPQQEQIPLQLSGAPG